MAQRRAPPRLGHRRTFSARPTRRNRQVALGWYRKHFKVKAAHKRRRVFLEVDGAMAFSAFWLNEHFVGGCPYVTVTIADTAGRRAPQANDSIQFRVSGPAEIAAVDNGDPTSLESFQARERRAFNGLALVILKAKRGRGGRIELIATAPGLRPGKLTIGSTT